MPDEGSAEAGSIEDDEAVVDTGDDQLVQRIVQEFTPDRGTRIIELLTTVILAVAAVLTAWAALQSAKWSGEQAIHFSEAGANRTESTRFDNRATSTVLLDVQSFYQWGAATQTDALAAENRGEQPPDPTVYDPDAPSLAGYFFSQLRDDFKPRVQAWLDGGGPLNPAGASPFDPFEDYLAESVPSFAEAERLAEIADQKSTEARQQNQNSDDYVVTVVILAAVLFFAGVASKMTSPINRNLMFFLALAMLIWAIVRLTTLPIHAIP